MSLPEEIINVVRLSEVATITDSLHSTPAYSLIGYPMVRVTDVRDFYLETEASLKVSKEIYKEFTKRETPQQGDIIFTRVGSYGNSCLTLQDKNFCLGQNTALIRPHIDPHYLLFCLKSPFIKEQIESSVVGSTQKTISIKSIKDLLIPIHSKEEIASISQILSSLQSKIELNRKTNETLEEIAKALFKSWFVDFDPVRAKAEGRPTGLPAEISDLFPDSFEDSELGEIPSGWEVHLLGEAVSIQYGKNLPTLNLIPKGFPVFGGNGVIGFHSDYLFEDVMTLVSCRGAASGAVLRSLPKSFVTNNSLVIDHRNTSVPSQRYVEFFLSNTDTSVFVTGSAQPQVTIDSIRHLPILIPQSRLVEVFQDDLAPIGIKALLVDRQSKCLASIRDALLPKLISGEIRIPDSEKMLEEVDI